MTKDDIVRMAREAGLPDPMVFYASYERFADLVAAHKAKFPLAEAYRCGYEAGAVAEREECAKVCEKEADNPSCLWEEPGCWQHAAENCAGSIRARGTHD